MEVKDQAGKNIGKRERGGFGHLDLVVEDLKIMDGLI